MKIIELFSKRQKRLRGEFPDVYQYTEFPSPLRVQIVHILRDAFGDSNKYNSETEECYRFIHDALCREYGQFKLLEGSSFGGVNHIEEVLNFTLQNNDVEKTLDVVELAFKVINGYCREYQFYNYSQPKISPDDAIEELNTRFKEHGVGYQFEGDEIIRVDSQLLHSSAVKPTLLLLSDKRFKGANEEFLLAHEHYRHGRYKECLVDCLKAFESTMKTICEIRQWTYNQTDTAKKLINVCFQNGLIPPYLQTQVSSLRQNLESGIPTVRNKLGGHGQGSQPKEVSQYFASYQLHMTASTILFLLEAEEALP